MNGKKSLLIVLVAMVVLIGGAYFLYEKLGAQVERPGLVVQEGAGSLTGTGNGQAGAAGVQGENASAGENAGAGNENGTAGGATGSETDGSTTQDGADSATGNGANTNGDNTDTNGGNTGNENGTTGSATDSTPDGTTASDGDTSDTTLTLAPDFTVYDAEGNAFKLSDFRGKPVVLNFWASWCGPCKSEMPDFQEVYEEYGEEIHFLMVNMTDGYQETIESASEFIADAGYTFPVYYDTASEAAYTYSVYSIPTTYFIDAEGYGVAYGSGAMNKDIIMMGIEMIHSEK